MREIERRLITVPVEWRAAPDGNGPGVLFGYAAKYNTDSQDLGGFIETIAPGAFTKTLKENARVLARYNHKDSHLLGTTEAGTLRVSSDDVGLPYEVDLPDTTSGRDLAVLAARGDVRYSSFAFYCIKDEWSFPDDGPARRVLREVQLVDVAPVNSPAYLDTSVAKRSLAERTADMETEQATTPPEDVRDSGSGETQEVEPPTHSTVPVSVQRALAELNEAK
jgi:HK97 family phage prohead protease